MKHVTILPLCVEKALDSKLYKLTHEYFLSVFKKATAKHIHRQVQALWSWEQTVKRIKGKESPCWVVLRIRMNMNLMSLYDYSQTFVRLETQTNTDLLWCSCLKISAETVKNKKKTWSCKSMLAVCIQMKVYSVLVEHERSSLNFISSPETNLNSRPSCCLELSAASEDLHK